MTALSVAVDGRALRMISTKNKTMKDENSDMVNHKVSGTDISSTEVL
jgi:hypothetical protein